MVLGLPSIQLALDFIAAFADALGTHVAVAHAAQAAQLVQRLLRVDVRHSLAMFANDRIVFFFPPIVVGEDGITVRIAHGSGYHCKIESRQLTALY